MIVLTSFKRYHELLAENPNARWPGFSVAVYQPSWYRGLLKLDIFDIRKGSTWIRPREFLPPEHDPSQPNPALLQRYHDTLVELYEERFRDTSKFLTEKRLLESARTGRAAFCCWCPYDQAAKRQLHDYGSFVCHTWPIETFLRSQGFDVVRDKDRKDMVSCI